MYIQRLRKGKKEARKEGRKENEVVWLAEREEEGQGIYRMPYLTVN